MINQQSNRHRRPRGVKHHYWDSYLLIPYLLLCVIGVVMVYSASAAIRLQNGGSPKAYLIKQLLFVIIGIAAMLTTALVPLEKFRQPRFLAFSTLVMFGMLFFVKVFGAAVNGAQGWIRLGMFSLQPAELCKLFLILYLADRFDLYARRGLKLPGDWQQMSPPFIVFVACFFLILIQPDTGGAVINLAIAAVIFMASEVSYKKSVGSIAAVIIFGYPLLYKLASMHILSGYQGSRFLAFIDPFGTAKGAGSQLVNSYYAISNGGVFGVGLGNSIQKMGYLPEPNTDFIMAVTAEELGLIGVSVILILLVVLICRIVWLGVRADSMFTALVCYGAAAFMTVEATFNIGGVVGILPITGVTFPFISYGGSSMLVLSLTLGLIVQVSSREKRSRLLSSAQQKQEG